MREIQVASGRQENEEMLNRSAVVVCPRQPFVDWLRSVEELEEPNITLEQLDKTLYLVPDYEGPKTDKRRREDPEAGLRRHLLP